MWHYCFPACGLTNTFAHNENKEYTTITHTAIIAVIVLAGEKRRSVLSGIAKSIGAIT